MISKVIKRDGSIVDFDPHKLLHWAEWAGVVGADWFEIASNAYKKLPENPTTKELQEAMIKACLDKEDTPHLMMAGRLLIGNLYKELFGGHEFIPSVKDMYKKMVAEGLWEDMSYSDEELDQINTIIDHSVDLRSPHSVINQVSKKYAVSDVESGKVLETPQFMWIRMAMGLCKDEPKETKIGLIKEYYELFLSYVNCPSPNMKNLGTPSKGYSSCCIFKSDDSAASLAAGDHIAYTMTCASAGIGGYLETRSKLDGVRKNTIRHSGKKPYFKQIESAVHANKQGSRGGAATMYYNCLDPEIMSLLRLRHPTTVSANRIGGIDYAFVFHPYLAEKYSRNEKWMLVSYKNAPDLHKAMYSSNYEEFVSKYNEYEKSKGKRTYTSARELGNEFLRMQEEIGREYEMNAYWMNHHTPFKDTIYSSNLCVAPETRILTKNGYETISTLENKTVEVWNGQEWSETTVRKTGENRKLLKVVTKHGYELECTPEHKFYTVKRYSKVLTEVRAKDLKKGDKLLKFELPVIEGIKELDYAYANGFYTGDGFLAENGEQCLYFYGEKKVLKDRCGDIFRRFYEYKNQDRNIGHTTLLKDKFFIPDCSYSIKSRLEWLAGLMDADGVVVRNGETQGFQIGSVEKNFLIELQLMLQTLGVSSKVTMNQKAGLRPLPANDGSGENKLFMCKDAYRLLIGNYGVTQLQKLGLNTSRLKTTDHVPDRECSHYIQIESVEDEGRYDDTYCFTEPKRHMGMFNGILTGQCLEIGLPTAGFKSVQDLYSEQEDVEGEIALCNLAAIIAGRVPKEKYERVAYLTLKMIDKIMDIMQYPFPHLKRTAQARRSVGVGITNLAWALAEQGLRYDSPEGKRYIHELAELHSYSLHKASVQLAKEKGKCDWINKTKYAEGWLPIDTYCKEVDKVVESSLLCDWESLRKDILEHGVRFSVLEAYMPVESSSVVSNTTNSLYPIREPVLIKTDGNNKNVFIAPDYEMLKDNYQMAWDVPYKDMIDVYAIVQKFTGQAISADTWRSFTEGEQPRLSAKELAERWMYRIKMGLKTKYYTNTAAGIKTKTNSDTDCESCKL